VGAYEAQASDASAPANCELVTPPTFASGTLSDTAACAQTRRVTEMATLVIGGNSGPGPAAAGASGSTAALGRLTRVVRPHHRVVLRLRLTRGMRARIRSAKRHGHVVRASVRLSAAKQARAHTHRKRRG
jgi:hypothetical protein